MVAIIPGQFIADKCSCQNTASDLKQTKVLRMTIEEASAKIAADTEVEEDQTEDYDYNCWAGIIPINKTFGKAIDDPQLKKNIVFPEHLNDFEEGKNIDTAFTHSANKNNK